MSQNPDKRLVPVQNSQVSGSSSNNSENQPSTYGNSDVTLPLGIALQHHLRPNNLQELLDFSTRYSSNESAPVQLSNENAEFVRNALDSLTMNWVPEMQKRLQVLKEIETQPENVVVANLNKYLETLEELIEYLYEIDLAQIFYQINGHNIIAPLLRSKHASLRSASAAIIYESCKNNPYCQNLSVTDEIFDPLMEMATSDPNKDAMFQAISAVSAIVRSNPAGISQFNKSNGIQMVEKALNSGCEKIVNKTIFFVMALCETDDTVKKTLTESGVVVTLITLLQLSDCLVKEYVLRALISFTKDNTTAQQICREHDLQTFLTSLCQTKTDPEYQDLVECATDLQKQLNCQ